MRPVVLLAVLILLTATTTIGCGSGNTGLPQPFTDAVTEMQEAGGYTFTATITTGDAASSSTVSVAGTFQAPDRIAQTVTRPGSSPVVMVLDGGAVHVQDPVTGTWSTQPSTASGTVDLRRTFAALAKAKDVSVDGSSATFTLDGDAARTLAGSDASGKVAVSIATGPVGLSRLSYRATIGGRQVTVTLDYTDVGMAPKVSVPG